MSAHAYGLSDGVTASSPSFPAPTRRRYCKTATASKPASRNSISRSGIADDIRGVHYADAVSDASVDLAALPSGSPRLKLHMTPCKAEVTSPPGLTPPENAGIAAIINAGIRSSPQSPPSSGLKLKLRGIQSAFKESLSTTDSFLGYSGGTSTDKRTSSEASFDSDSDTDSDIDIMPPSRKVIKATVEKLAARNPSRKAKKVKVMHDDSDYREDAICDAEDEASSPGSSAEGKLVLSSNILKRSERILDPANPDHAALIGTAIKAGPEYYDSDADELPGGVKDTNKPHLFRNVKWGSLATDYSNPEEFATEPEFTQFVPGRFERLPDGTAADQKHKLIIKLIDKQHRQRIFLNPPPRDWNNQEAITALNKRTVQQIRRNTSVRFREVVEPYVKAEREWILAHLTDGKPANGWKKFVDEFNRQFEGRILAGSKAARPERSHSSLTKEVERFGSMYAKGLVPKTVSQGMGKEKASK